MKEENRMRKQGKIIVFIAGISIVVFVGYKGYQFYEKEKLKKDFYNMLTTIDNSLQEWVEPCFNGYELVESVETKSSTTFEYVSEENWYQWNENYNMDIYVDSSFDKYSEKEQYEYIKNVGSFAISTIFNEINCRYPEYNRYHGVYELQDEVFGKFVSKQKNEKIRVLTKQNTYEYSGILDDYFVKNDKDIYVRDENGEWDSGLSSWSNLERNDDTTEIVTNEDDLASCWLLAQNAVKNNLKSPSTAKFPSSYLNEEVVITRTGKDYVVSSWVDAQNSFGAILRRKFSVVLTKEGVGIDAKFKVSECLIE